MDELLARTDRGELARPVSARVYEGRAARVHARGDGLYYPATKDRPEHTEYRDAGELARIAEQLPGTPVTLQHPSKLIAEGGKPLVVGTVIGGRVDGEHVVARFVITDPEGDAAIRRGVRELSLGYLAHTDADGFQRDTTLDHLALVPRARCGGTCAVRADQAEPAACACQHDDWDESKDDAAAPAEKPAEKPAAPMCECGDSSCEGHRDASTCKSRAMPHTRGVMDELQKQLAAALADAATQRARADAAEKALEHTGRAHADADTALKVAIAERDSARRDVEAAKAESAAALAKAKMDADSARDVEVSARVDAMTKANAILGVEDRSKMSTRDIKAAVIAHVDGADALPTDAIPQVVDVLFQGAVKRAEVAKASRSDALTTLDANRKAGVAPTNVDSEKSAQAGLRSRLASAWMTPAKSE